MNKKDLAKNRKILDSYDAFEACSATECTGLIQLPAKTYEEWNGYNEIMSFSPPQKNKAVSN